MAAPVVLPKDFDAQQLFIDPVPQKNKAGGKFIRVCYGPKKATLKLQSPALYMPFGLSSFEDDKGVTTQSVEVSLRGHEEPGSVHAFYRALQAIDAAILQAAEANSRAWFGKEMPRALLQEFQRTLVKPPRDPRYAPLFKAKVVKDFKTGELPKVFDLADRATVQPPEYLVKGTTGKVIVTLPSVYLINKTFGVSARLAQALVLSRPAQDEGCLIVSDDAEDFDAAVCEKEEEEGPLA